MPGDDHALHLVRALADLEDLLVAVEARDRRLLHEPVAAVQLQRGVDDAVRELARVQLGLRRGEREVTALVGRSYDSLWRMMCAGKFPRGRYLGQKVFWFSAEIEDWLANLPKQRLKGDALREDNDAS